MPSEPFGYLALKRIFISNSTFRVNVRVVSTFTFLRLKVAK